MLLNHPDRGKSVHCWRSQSHRWPIIFLLKSIQSRHKLLFPIYSYPLSIHQYLKSPIDVLDVHREPKLLSNQLSISLYWQSNTLFRSFLCMALSSVSSKIAVWIFKVKMPIFNLCSSMLRNSHNLDKMFNLWVQF